MLAKKKLSIDNSAIGLKYLLGRLTAGWNGKLLAVQRAGQGIRTFCRIAFSAS
jgi:hypothetical protein